MCPQIEVSEEELKQIKEKLGIVDKEISSYEDLVGEKVFFRTVTYHACGEVKKIVGRFVHLKNASWIADTGRFMNFIKDGVQTNSEVEPVGEMFLNMDTVVDMFIVNWKMPKDQK